MMLPLILGLACLLVLQLVVVGDQARGRTAPLLFLAGFAGALLAVHAWLQPPRYLPAASTSAVSKRIAEDLRAALRDGRQHDIVLLDGGSYTARGVDQAQLEARLSQRLGRPVTVLADALAGGNQYERWSVLRNGLALLDADERRRLGQQRITLLLEIHGQYDRYPLVQLRRNRYSDRAYAYLQPDVALASARAEHGPMDAGARLRQWSDVVVHAAANAFNVGAATRVVDAAGVEPAGGFDGIGKPARGYRFKGMKKVLRSLDQDPDGHAGKLPQANIRARRERIAGLFGATPEVIYYSVPTPRVGDLQYARAFCHQFRQFDCIDHARPALLRRLDAKRFWYDDGHLQRRGARLYTRWLSWHVAERMKQEGAGAAP